jgi:hypothetical protein
VSKVGATSEVVTAELTKRAVAALLAAITYGIFIFMNSLISRKKR